MDYKDYHFPFHGAPQAVGHSAWSSGVWAMMTSMGAAKNVLNAIRGIPDWRTNDPDGDRHGLPPLFKTKKGLYIRLLYAAAEDTFNRPIDSEPSDWINCVIREYASSKGYFSPLISTDRRRRCLNLSSYNYLGFGGSNRYVDQEEILTEAVAHLPISTASPSAELGYHPVHRQLEQKIAKFLDKEDAVVFGMGFATNSTVLPALVGKGDLLISDLFNHTSIVQGARESGAKIKTFIHNDPYDLEKVLQDAVLGPRKYGKILIVVEGIYSMEGDMANLKEILPIAKRYGAYVYLDEAHSIGAVGRTGRGVTEEQGVGTKDISVMMGTFSKSFGAAGGYIAGDRHVVNRVRRLAAGATDSASMPPAVALQIINALKTISGEDGTDIGQKKLVAIRENSDYFRDSLREMGFEVLGESPSPVIPVMLYTPTKIGDFSRLAFNRGLAVVTVGAPAVPLMYGRVRFCISAAHKKEDLTDALKKIDEIGDILKMKYCSKHKPNPYVPGTLLSLEHKLKAEAKQRKALAAVRRSEALEVVDKIKWNPLVRKEEGKARSNGWADSKLSAVYDCKVNVSSWDYLGLTVDPIVQAKCIKILKKRGLGSCGPRGFYGTFPEHENAEIDLANFLGCDQAVLYPFGACTVSSVISCMAGKGDVLVVDEGCGRNVMTGVYLAKAKVYYYKHGDAEDCERILKTLCSEEWRSMGGILGPNPKRKFIISEAVFGSTGELAPVDKLAALRLKYKCRFILDESHSFGMLGETGKGATEHFGIGINAVDVICASLEGSGSSCCGFSAGPTGVVAYQRLLSSGYVYSASPPPYLAAAVSASLMVITKAGTERLASLRKSVKVLRERISDIPGLKVTGSVHSPMVSVALDDHLDTKGRSHSDILDEICRIAQYRGVAICRFSRPELGLKSGFKFPEALRVCGSSKHTENQLDFVIEVVSSAARKVLGRFRIVKSVSLKMESKLTTSKKLSFEPATPVDTESSDYLMKKPVVRRNFETSGVTMPILVTLWAILSLYREFLNHESVITGRFVNGWLHMFRLDKDSTSPAVRSFYHIARCMGSHRTYSAVLPVVFWMGGSSSAALPFILYSLACCAGCMMKCAMGEGNTERARSWPSITAMNAVALPFFELRYHLGYNWLVRFFGPESVGTVIIALMWVFTICFSRLEIGDSPSNIVGGLVAGSAAIHVMLRFAGPTVAWMEGNTSAWLCPPLYFALCTILFCPLPTSGRAFAVNFYQHAAKHAVSLIGFLTGVALVPVAVAEEVEMMTMITRGVIGFFLFVILQTLSVFASRKCLAWILTGVCSAVPSLRDHGIKIYDSAEPIVNSLSYGLLMSTVVPTVVARL